MTITKPVAYGWRRYGVTYYITDEDHNVAPHVVIGRPVATQVTNAAADQTAPTWSTLGGQRIGDPTHKGVYLKNGKKVVVK